MKKILLSVFLVLAMAIPAVAQNLDAISGNPIPETAQLVQGMAQDMRRGLIPGPMMDTPKEEMALQGTTPVAMRPMSIMTCDEDYWDCDADGNNCTGTWPYYWGHSQNYLYSGYYGSVFAMVELKGYGTVKMRVKVIDGQGIVHYDQYYTNTLASSGWQQWRFWDYTNYYFAPGLYTVQLTWKVGTVSLTQTAKVRVMD